MKQQALIVILLFGIFLYGCGGNNIEQQTELDVEKVTTSVAATVLAEIQIEEPVATPEPTKEPEPQIGTRDNPVPLDIVFKGVIDGSKYFDFSINQVIRGQDAYQMISSANMFNDPPPEGQEYIVVKAILDYITSDNPDDILEFNSYNFKTVSNNQIIDTPFVVNPDPQFEVQLFPGGRGEGYFSLLVFIDDPSPLISMGTNMFDNTNRVYFAIN